MAANEVQRAEWRESVVRSRVGRFPELRVQRAEKRSSFLPGVATPGFVRDAGLRDANEAPHPAFGHPLPSRRERDEVTLGVFSPESQLRGSLIERGGQGKPSPCTTSFFVFTDGG
jgi:hypothetical protein